MTYLILKNKVSKEEVKARIQYIWEVFHIFAYIDYSKSMKNGIVLKTIPESALDLFVIVGHSPDTNIFINNKISMIKEKNVVVISCNTKTMENLSKIYKKNMYLPSSCYEVDIYHGENFGFDFEITKEEILMYRNKDKAYKEMLDDCYERKYLDGENN